MEALVAMTVVPRAVQELVVDLFGRWSWSTAEVLADYFKEEATEPGLDVMLRAGPTRNLRWRLIDLLWMMGLLTDQARERAYNAHSKESWWVGWTYDAHVYARTAELVALRRRAHLFVW